MITKKIKVRITKGTAAWYYPNATGQMIKYVPGDILLVEERFFRSDIMEKWPPPTPVPAPVEGPAESAETEEPEKKETEETSEKPDRPKEEEKPEETDEYVAAEDTLVSLGGPEVSEKSEPKKRKTATKTRRR